MAIWKTVKEVDQERLSAELSIRRQWNSVLGIEPYQIQWLHLYHLLFYSSYCLSTSTCNFFMYTVWNCVCICLNKKIMVQYMYGVCSVSYLFHYFILFYFILIYIIGKKMRTSCWSTKLLQCRKQQLAWMMHVHSGALATFLGVEWPVSA